MATWSRRNSVDTMKASTPICAYRYNFARRLRPVRMPSRHISAPTCCHPGAPNLHRTSKFTLQNFLNTRFRTNRYFRAFLCDVITRPTKSQRERMQKGSRVHRFQGFYTANFTVNCRCAQKRTSTSGATRGGCSSYRRACLAVRACTRTW